MMYINNLFVIDTNSYKVSFNFFKIVFSLTIELFYLIIPEIIIYTLLNTQKLILRQDNLYNLFKKNTILKLKNYNL